MPLGSSSEAPVISPGPRKANSPARAAGAASSGGRSAPPGSAQRAPGDARFGDGWTASRSIVERLGKLEPEFKLHARPLKPLRQGREAPDRADHLLDPDVDVGIA